MSLGTRVNELRTEKNMKQYDLATALKVTPSYVSRIEADKVVPSDTLISMLSFIFHVEERWIKTGEGTKESRVDQIYEAISGKPELTQRFTAMILHESQRKRLGYLFAPASPRLDDMLEILFSSPAQDFLTRLNLLIKEWIDCKDDIRKKARIEVRMEEAVEDFPVKLAEYNQIIANIAGDGIVSFDEITASETPSAPARVMLPVLGRAAAGAPKSMISLEGEELRTNGDVAHDIRPGDFIVIADGDSMVDCGIHDGDHCVIHQTPEVSNGQIALVAVEDGSTIKRFYKEKDGFRLVPCSPDHEEQHYPSDAPIRVLGKFVKVIQPDPES